MMKKKAYLPRWAKVAVFTIGLGITLAGCSTADKIVVNPGDKMESHKNSVGPANKPAASSNDAQPANGEVEIVIDNFVYTPAEVTVAPGTKVTWTNKDEAPHTATSTDNKFNSGGLDTGDKFSFVFNDKGDYPYFCTLHPHMKATVKVK